MLTCFLKSGKFVPQNIGYILGLLDISKDPVFSTIFDNLPKDCVSDKEVSEEQSYFMQHVNDFSMQLTLYQESVQQYKNLFVVDSAWSVSSVVKLAEDKYVTHIFLVGLNVKQIACNINRLFSYHYTCIDCIVEENSGVLLLELRTMIMNVYMHNFNYTKS